MEDRGLHLWLMGVAEGGDEFVESSIFPVGWGGEEVSMSTRTGHLRWAGAAKRTGRAKEGDQTGRRRTKKTAAAHPS